MNRAPLGYFALTLHTHIPFVLGHGRWPHGSDWLSEVTVDCYLPLLDTLQALAAARLSPHLTINISPVLAEQLAAPAYKVEIEGFLRARIQSVRENRAEFARDGRDQLVGLTEFWEAFYRHRLEQFERLNGDLVGAFHRLQEEDHIELITCPATHGYLPLLRRDESIDLQLRVAIGTHAKRFGHPPAGVWLPECAYRPRYEWTPPAGPMKGKQRVRRRGIEEFLADQGLTFFFTDVHLVRGGRPISVYRDIFPALRTLAEAEGPSYPRDRTPYLPYIVASRGGRGSAIAFVREPETTLQVWSREGGYPGDEWYLEFHKKHFPGGQRYWRVTHPKSDLADKQLYEPARAAERARVHGEHFVGLLAQTLASFRAETGHPGIACSPYDTELFGHWWFEGPQWIQEVYHQLAESGIEPIDCPSYLEHHPPTQAVSLLEGSWGEGGDHRVWLNHDTEWAWDRVYTAEDEFWTLARAARGDGNALIRRVLAQLARELLLLQASDWQFLITTWAARNYAETRLAEHYANFTRLAQFLRRLRDGGTISSAEEEFLTAREEQNFIFPDVSAHVEAACELPAP